MILKNTALVGHCLIFWSVFTFGWSTHWLIGPVLNTEKPLPPISTVRHNIDSYLKAAVGPSLEISRAGPSKTSNSGQCPVCNYKSNLATDLGNIYVRIGLVYWQGLLIVESYKFLLNQLCSPREVDRRLLGQNVTHRLRNVEVHYRVYSNPLLGSVMSETDQSVWPTFLNSLLLISFRLCMHISGALIPSYFLTECL
jgi:hypothetical protein